jgi:serine protease AprX
MAAELPRALVEFILVGPEEDRRQLQDSPILGDVWIEFAKAPGESLDLLITPYKDHPAGNVAADLVDRLPQKGTPPGSRDTTSRICRGSWPPACRSTSSCASSFP